MFTRTVPVLLVLQLTISDDETVAVTGIAGSSTAAH